jgi:hypothetical protein
MSTPEENAAESDEGPGDRPPEGTTRRQWLIRLLVGLGLGIPITIEGLTFVGLIRTRLLGEGDGSNGDDGGGTGTETPRPTVSPGGVGVGDELLPASRPVDRVDDLVLIPDGGTWTFSMTVAVENTGEDPYELILGSVETDDGKRVPGSNRATGQLAAGESGRVTGVWEVPADSEIATIKAIAVVYAGDARTITEEVPLADVSLQDTSASN